MKRLLNSHPLLWALLAIPGAIMLGRYWTGAATYGEVVHLSGDWSARLLIATLAVTPIRLTFRRARWPAWLVQRRRDLGVACFAYALGHTLVYVVRKAELARIIEEGKAPELLTGWIALLLFAGLAATSNDASVRWLGRTWKRLHRVVYLGAALTFAHWLLTAFDPMTGYVYLGVLIALEAWRLALTFRASRSS